MQSIYASLMRQRTIFGIFALVALLRLLGFAYRIDLEPWVFVASSLVALVIAMVTVSTHSMLVARANAVTALRYE